MSDNPIPADLTDPAGEQPAPVSDDELAPVEETVQPTTDDRPTEVDQPVSDDQPVDPGATEADATPVEEV